MKIAEESSISGIWYLIHREKCSGKWTLSSGIIRGKIQYDFLQRYRWNICFTFLSNFTYHLNTHLNQHMCTMFFQLLLHDCVHSLHCVLVPTRHSLSAVAFCLPVLTKAFPHYKNVSSISTPPITCLIQYLGSWLLLCTLCLVQTLGMCQRTLRSLSKCFIFVFFRWKNNV